MMECSSHLFSGKDKIVSQRPKFCYRVCIFLKIIQKTIEFGYVLSGPRGWIDLRFMPGILRKMLNILFLATTKIICLHVDPHRTLQFVHIILS